MSGLITRIFRVLKMPIRRRQAATGSQGAPINLQPGELVYGEEENTLYIGREDGTTATIGDGGDEDGDGDIGNATIDGGAY